MHSREVFRPGSCIFQECEHSLHPSLKACMDGVYWLAILGHIYIGLTILAQK